MPAALTVRDLTLSAENPRIIAPIVGTTQEDILLSAHRIAAHPHIDLAEWRADYFHEAPAKCTDVLAQLRGILQEKPLLFTFRSAKEGGKKDISPDRYITLCHAAAASGLSDLIDVEMFSAAAADCVKAIHACGVAVVGSWHDFAQTPSEKDLLDRFEKMQSMGADVLKIAVMPRCLADVEHLISAAQKAAVLDRPLCAVAMGDLGQITRTNCRHFGGCMTFGALDGASAPGQIPADALFQALHST